MADAATGQGARRELPAVEAQDTPNGRIRREPLPAWARNLVKGCGRDELAGRPMPVAAPSTDGE